MEVPLRRGPSVGMLFALFCFFLPFMTLSCPGGSFTFSGVQFATGTTIQEPQMFGKTTERKIPAEPLATAAFGLTIVAALIGLASTRTPRLATASIAAVNFVLLLLLKSKLDKEALSQGGGMFQVTWGLGFWLALAGYASTVAVVTLILRGTDPPASAPISTTSTSTE